MCHEFTDLPISIKSLAQCDQEQLNSIAHLIETKSVSIKSNPSGFILTIKENDMPIFTMKQLSDYYQKMTGQPLKMGQSIKQNTAD